MMRGPPTRRKPRYFSEHCSSVNVTLKRKKGDGGFSFSAESKIIQDRVVVIQVKEEGENKSQPSAHCHCDLHPVKTRLQHRTALRHTAPASQWGHESPTYCIPNL